MGGELKCRVPMWMGGCPSGHCGEPAYGEQLPIEILEYDRSYGPNHRPPYCFGPCCPNHGGPKADEIRFFQDGTENGRRMWCAVYPDFINLQESPAGFDINPLIARQKLKRELAKVSQP